MRSLLALAFVTLLLSSCDDERVFEKNADFHTRFWDVGDRPAFDFSITDSLQRYNLYCNVRNSLDYPYARIFITWTLRDSTGAVLERNLMQHMLFDEKTGEPFGGSGLGDIYDHRIPLKSNYAFPHTGQFTLSLEQYMRTDTLAGVLAVGVRLERYTSSQ